jgi:hypothetical protein
MDGLNPRVIQEFESQVFFIHHTQSSKSSDLAHLTGIECSIHCHGTLKSDHSNAVREAY